MWLSEAPAEALNLRQGDLLQDVPFPTLADEPSIAQGVVALPARVRDALVVSQCCTIENQRSVALAPLLTMDRRKQREDHLSRLQQQEPPADGGAFLARLLLLEPVAGLDAKDHHLKVADLTKIVTFTGGEHAWLQARRIARMSAVGRRRLRIRLAAFWTRVEADDEEELLALGLPLGADLAFVINLPPGEPAVVER